MPTTASAILFGEYLRVKYSLIWSNKVNAGKYRYTTKDGRTDDYVYIVVKLFRRGRGGKGVKDLKDDLAKKLGISKRSVSYRIQALCKAGILKKLGRVGKRGYAIYASGFFMPWSSEGKGGNNRIYFISQLPDREKVLCNLKIRF